MRSKWIAWQLGMAALWSMIILWGFSTWGSHTPAEIVRPLLWALVAALSHSLLGVRLIGSGKPSNPAESRGINGGLIILVIRYLTGAGLVLSGLLAFPDLRTVFATSWSGLFLILLVSEMIIFSKGVNRL